MMLLFATRLWRYSRPSVLLLSHCLLTLAVQVYCQGDLPARAYVCTETEKLHVLWQHDMAGDVDGANAIRVSLCDKYRPEKEVVLANGTVSKINGSDNILHVIYKIPRDLMECESLYDWQIDKPSIEEQANPRPSCSDAPDFSMCPINIGSGRHGCPGYIPAVSMQLSCLMTEQDASFFDGQCRVAAVNATSATTHVPARASMAMRLNVVLVALVTTLALVSLLCLCAALICRQRRRKGKRHLLTPRSPEVAPVSAFALLADSHQSRIFCQKRRFLPGPCGGGYGHLTRSPDTKECIITAGLLAARTGTVSDAHQTIRDIDVHCKSIVRFDPGVHCASNLHLESDVIVHCKSDVTCASDVRVYCESDVHCESDVQL